MQKNSPETEILHSAIRVFLGVDSPEILEEHLSRPWIEETFLKLCSHHRLDLVIAKVLVPKLNYFLSSGFRNALSRKKNRLVASHLRLARLTTEISEQLESIPHAFLKGPVLAETLFPNQVLRYSSDLDILVPPDKLPEVDLILRRMGFLPESTSDDLKNRGFFFKALHRDVCYRKPSLREGIELHWKTAAVEGLIDSITTQVQHESFHGRPVPVLEDYLNCLYLAFHAAKHHWSRLRWLLDIVIFIRKKDLDWRLMWEKSNELKMQTAILEAAILSEKLWGIPTPLEINPEITRRLKRRMELYADPNRTPLGSAEMFLSLGYLYGDPRKRFAAWAYHGGLLIHGRVLKTISRNHQV